MNRGSPESDRPGRPTGRSDFIDLSAPSPRRLVDESEVRVSEARKAAILESSLDAVVAIDAEGRITEFNPAAERTFGYRRGDVVGRSMAEILIPERTRKRHREAFARYLATGESQILGRTVEMNAMRSDGTEFPVELAIARIDTAGPPSFTASIRDISGRKRRERALEESLERRRHLEAMLVQAQEDERKRLAWDLHDDSIQIMTAVGLRLRAFRRRNADPTLHRELDDLERVVGEAIGRLRALLFELRPVTLDRDGLVPALRSYLEVMGREGIAGFLDDRLRTEPDPQTRTLLFRVAQEALTNVRKHARASRVEVEVEEVNAGILLRVRDDGVGFSTRRPVDHGHLGLVAMRERAEVFGGWLRVSSEPGRGTTLEVWIPARLE